MENKIFMNYCPCCGRVSMGSKNCSVCNTTLIPTDMEMDVFFDISQEERNKWKNELFETKIKPNPLYNAQKMQARIIAEQNEEMGQNTQNIPKCPICGSTNIHKISGANKVASALTFGVFAVGHVSKTYKCDNCKSKF